MATWAPPFFLFLSSVLCYTHSQSCSTFSLYFLEKSLPHFPVNQTGVGFYTGKERNTFQFITVYSSFPPISPVSALDCFGFVAKKLRVGMKMEKNLCCCGWISLCCLLLAAANVSSKNHGNQANDLVDIINKNRTSQKLPQLNNSPGLGCMALQYVEECKGNCSVNDTLNCHIPEDDFTEVFAPNCGVELPTFGTISALIVGCQHKYLKPWEAFSTILAHDNKTLSLVRNRSHTEVGVGLIGTRNHKGPYFWCVMFSDSPRNTTFVLEDLGKGIEQKRGCYSGTGNSCSEGRRNSGMFLTSIWGLVFTLCILLRTSISM